MLRQNFDSSGKAGSASWQRILIFLRRLADGSSNSSLDEQAGMSTESMRCSFNAFIQAVNKFYGSEYLNSIPTSDELCLLEKGHALRNFPGCIVSLDCMHLHWNNSPNCLEIQYHNPFSWKLTTIHVEAGSDYKLHCWYAFSRIVGTNYDLTILESSSFITSILSENRAMELEKGFLKLASILSKRSCLSQLVDFCQAYPQCYECEINCDDICTVKQTQRCRKAFWHAWRKV